MENLSFLKKILMSPYSDEYWIVARRNTGYSLLTRGEIYPDSIILTAIPQNITREVKETEILLCEIEKLRNSEMMNIFINEPYAPFQYGQTFSQVYDGYPIKTNVKEFMLKAIALNSNNLWDYRHLVSEPELTTNQ